MPIDSVYKLYNKYFLLKPLYSADQNHTKCHLQITICRKREIFRLFIFQSIGAQFLLLKEVFLLVLLHWKMRLLIISFKLKINLL